jgi:hypothetical protein
MQAEHGDVDSALRHVIEDRLVPGMGQVWMRYEAEFAPAPTYEQAMGMPQAEEPPLEGNEPAEPSETPAEEQAEAEPDEIISDERVITDYVHWSDFRYSPARVWEEVRWVARRTWMTREELVEAFGKLGELVPLSSKGGTDKTNDAMRNDPWAKAGVWEIWCKTSRKVYFVVRGFEQILKTAADPFGLVNFYPCPRPLLANTSTSELVPRADYTVLKKTYAELDAVSERISLLESAIRVVGAYDKQAAPELGAMLNRTGTNQMIAVDSWAMFAEKGGIKGVVDWFPIEEVVNALIQLRTVKAELKNELYELTGLSDIMRGATQAQETATAQQIKAQFASVRLQYMQGEFARFVQDFLAIKAEIMAEVFQPATLKAKSLIEKTFDAPYADQAIALLKDKRLAYYSLTVEPDSMAMVDYMAEQEAAQKFLAAFSGFLQQAFPLAQAQPQTLPFLLQMLSVVVARFRFGKQVEALIDQAVQQALAAPQQPDPNEAAMKEATLKKTQSEAAKNFATAEKQAAEAKRQPAVAAADIARAREDRANAVTDVAAAFGGGQRGF